MADLHQAQVRRALNHIFKLIHVDLLKPLDKKHLCPYQAEDKHNNVGVSPLSVNEMCQCALCLNPKMARSGPKIKYT